jgi:hypothetical protein
MALSIEQLQKIKLKYDLDPEAKAWVESRLKEKLRAGNPATDPENVAALAASTARDSLRRPWERPVTGGPDESSREMTHAEAIADTYRRDAREIAPRLGAMASGTEPVITGGLARSYLEKGVSPEQRATPMFQGTMGNYGGDVALERQLPGQGPSLGKVVAENEAAHPGYAIGSAALAARPWSLAALMNHGVETAMGTAKAGSTLGRAALKALPVGAAAAGQKLTENAVRGETSGEKLVLEPAEAGAVGIGLGAIPGAANALTGHVSEMPAVKALLAGGGKLGNSVKDYAGDRLSAFARFLGAGPETISKMGLTPVEDGLQAVGPVRVPQRAAESFRGEPRPDPNRPAMHQAPLTQALTDRMDMAAPRSLGHQYPPEPEWHPGMEPPPVPEGEPRERVTTPPHPMEVKDVADYERDVQDAESRVPAGIKPMGAGEYSAGTKRLRQGFTKPVMTHAGEKPGPQRFTPEPIGYEPEPVMRDPLDAAARSATNMLTPMAENRGKVIGEGLEQFRGKLGNTPEGKTPVAPTALGEALMDLVQKGTGPDKIRPLVTGELPAALPGAERARGQYVSWLNQIYEVARPTVGQRSGREGMMLVPVAKARQLGFEIPDGMSTKKVAIIPRPTDAGQIFGIEKAIDKAAKAADSGITPEDLGYLQRSIREVKGTLPWPKKGFGEIPSTEVEVREETPSGARHAMNKTVSGVSAVDSNFHRMMGEHEADMSRIGETAKAPKPGEVRKDMADSMRQYGAPGTDEASRARENIANKDPEALARLKNIETVRGAQELNQRGLPFTLEGQAKLGMTHLYPWATMARDYGPGVALGVAQSPHRPNALQVLTKEQRNAVLRQLHLGR